MAIARAMVGKPDLLLADEPTGALDTKAGNQIMDIFHRLSQEGMTIIMITHERQSLPAQTRPTGFWTESCIQARETREVTGMNWNPKNKKRLVMATAGVLVAALGVGIWAGVRGGAEPVGVYPFSTVGMTEFWGDSKESYGPVTTDKIQTVFLSDTQIVTEVLVSQGDTVKKGDLLMTFDTTLSELELERKRLEVEKLKLELTDAQNYLAEINGMKPHGAARY